MIIKYMLDYTRSYPFSIWTDGTKRMGDTVWHSAKIYCTKGGNEFFIANGKRVHLNVLDCLPGEYNGWHIQKLD